MVKLLSGKELEVKSPNRKQALKLKIASAAGYDGYDVFWDAACIGLGLTSAQLEAASEHTHEEIISIAGLVFEKMNLSDTQKKS